MCVLTEEARGARPPEAGVKGDTEPPTWVLRMNLSPLQEQSELLTTQLSLQSTIIIPLGTSLAIWDYSK